MAKEDNKLNTKQKIFGIILIIAALVMIYYGISKGLETIAYRFILGGVFVFILAIALFKNKVNTKPVGIIFFGYLILDVLLVVLSSGSFSTNLILEVGLILVVIYFVFIKNKR